ncbi:Ribosomal protein S12 methylthiotransferase RimO [Pseudomonas sp. MM227]|jgi:ribosomal protein S12 methylthiotransferase|uniref:Ribosomal protein uS12 methylthiotransferase RimO n=1 Tax=Pseudomonas baltica TaxID=2762576 RepID=A0A7X1G576_9PSED|nr:MULTISPECIES: 30S ribosomal protein S12 methylthiotransferase RimO [Pseudomonas]MBC2678725.1 30S ribosomal protein S12 methylthiotransferase RimO [Pseudomonas baltica]MBD8591929.1 30S ribosomal protein S12 methylthiotransferase RimO [Pseudomonas sp. CFBP 8758]MBD8604752.1 30S ribosomal protein S12 methylthiotransferase RimO [Pseudomonas sp. CFBP 8771]MBD8622859.1 30S ribosomal protein S12 methylthiotransferase RimO [Pseudomonas sp. CFBP 13727]CAI3789347.1 Ribosomal protein S12 methylthiotra
MSTTPSSAAPKVGFVSLGCPKALVDSERILTQLRMEGYQVVSTYEDADVVVVNTCGFIDTAKAESLEVIGEALKENGKVIVTGCMGVEENAIRKVHPSVLSVTGPQQYEQVVNAVHQVVPPRHDHNPLIDLVPPQGIKLTPRHYAYLKISEGCNHSCSFCIIPSMRGKLVSRPVGDVLSEAERLVKAGVKEVLVISQDTSAYGVDVKYKTDFWNGRPVKTRMLELCEALSTLGVWVRLHYVYPYPNVDDIIPLMAAGKILPYLDIPFQHASPKVLKAMKRPAFEDKTLARIKKWREQCPDLIIRSTFIVGFPGETEEDFQYLLDWLSEAQLDRVGCFQYSPVEGAPANLLDAAIVPDDVKQDRWDRFMAHQQAISAARLQMRIGKRVEVLIDEVEEQGAVGRCFFDAPEIDGNVFIDDATHLKPGDKVWCTIVDADEYDLWAELA